MLSGPSVPACDPGDVGGPGAAVAARTGEQVEQVAGEIGGLALEVDVSDEASVARMVEETERRR